MEELFYDRLYQRCGTKLVLQFLKENAFTIHTNKFVDKFNTLKENNPFYTKTVIKTLIDNIDLLNEDDGRAIEGKIQVESIDDVYLSEWLYEEYINLLKVTRPRPTTKDIVQYRFNNEIKIKIEETPYVISAEGTTGFRTWEAALYLTQYLLDNSSSTNVKNVLELGAGTGMVSIGLAKRYRNEIENLYITDGDSQLVETQLKRNFELNFSKDDTQPTNMKYQKLWWNIDEVPNDIDLVVAADVTYDSSVIPDLCQCLQQCLTSTGNPDKICLLSATIRNEETIKSFESECAKLNLKCVIIMSTTTDIQGEQQLVDNLLFKPLIAPIRIYQIQA